MTIRVDVDDRSGGVGEWFGEHLDDPERAGDRQVEARGDLGRFVVRASGFIDGRRRRC